MNIDLSVLHSNTVSDIDISGKYNISNDFCQFSLHKYYNKFFLEMQLENTQEGIKKMPYEFLYS